MGGAQYLLSSCGSCPATLWAYVREHILISPGRGDGKRLLAATVRYAVHRVRGPTTRYIWSDTKPEALHWSARPKVPGGPRCRMVGAPYKMGPWGPKHVVWTCGAASFFGSGGGTPGESGSGTADQRTGKGGNGEWGSSSWSHGEPPNRWRQGCPAIGTHGDPHDMA